jgi:mono/diheme cytochrome c family protein
MSKIIRFQVALAAGFLLAGAVGFSQSGGAIYKAKCQSCHGAAGMADTPVGKALKVRPITDPAVRKSTEAQMMDATRNGMGKMQPFKGKVTDAQIKESVEYFRAFIK